MADHQEAHYHRLLTPTDSLYDVPIVNNFGSNRTFNQMLGSTGYDRSRMDREMTVLHNQLSDSERRVIVIVKDSGDVDGPGLSFTLGYDSTLKHVFEAFGAASCKKCKAPGEFRFKVGAKRLSASDTPKKLGIKHDHTLSIKAYAKRTTSSCYFCKLSGYPTSGSTRLDGDFPVNLAHLAMGPTQKKAFRLLFEDPNGKIVAISTSSNKPLKAAMSDYAGRSECSLGTLRFFFEDERLSEEDRANELGMENNAIIRVHMEQMSA